MYNFQYPRTDRIGCDSAQNPARVGRGLTFSILERIESAATPVCSTLTSHALCFQYPRTDRIGCDIKAARTNGIFLYLSVSSNGSNRLRQWRPPKATGNLLYFQYPRTDRIGCDSAANRSRIASGSLSVSSNGSNRLRLGASHNPDLLRRSFQYPRTDRIGCDWHTVGTLR